eukprot:69984-Rhodomonas_salina.2
MVMYMRGLKKSSESTLATANALLRAGDTLSEDYEKELEALSQGKLPKDDPETSTRHWKTTQERLLEILLPPGYNMDEEAAAVISDQQTWNENVESNCRALIKFIYDYYKKEDAIIGTFLE